MIITLLFIFFLLLENLFLPALIGPEPFFIVILFITAMLIYSQNIKPRLIQATVFLFIAEIVSGAGYGSFIIPFAIIACLYLWLNRYLEISSSLQESGSYFGILGGLFVISLFVFGYSFLSLFIQASYNIVGAWQNFVPLIKISAYQTLLWAFFFVILFKYVLRAK